MEGVTPIFGAWSTKNYTNDNLLVTAVSSYSKVKLSLLNDARRISSHFRDVLDDLYPFVIMIIYYEDYSSILILENFEEQL